MDSKKKKKTKKEITISAFFVQCIFKYENWNYEQSRSKQTTNLYLVGHKKHEEIFGKVQDDKAVQSATNCGGTVNRSIS